MPIGWLYNDGGHVTCNATRAIVLNANSEYKEGSWEFVNYLLTEGQNKFTWELAVDYPVKKAAYDEWAQKEIEAGSYIVTEKNGHMVQSYKS